MLDFNLDGIQDLVVACPTSGDKDLVLKGGTYQGRVLVYFGGQAFSGQPDVVIQSENYLSNFGHNLRKVTVNGREDLVVGSPYESQDLQQHGFLYFFKSDNSYQKGL